MNPQNHTPISFMNDQGSLLSAYNSDASTLAPPTPALPAGRPPMPEFLSNTMFVCDHVLMPLVCSLGILGNGLSVCVLTRREMAAATTCFLTAMAVSDILLLGLQVPTFFQLNPYIAASDGFKRFIRSYTILRYVMTNVFITCTCWLTVAVTTERFISLRFMFHPRLVCTLFRARLAIIAVFILSFVFHFSKFFEYVPNEDLSSPRPVLETYLVHMPSYETYLHVTNILLAVIIPVFLLVVANSFLVFFLATHRRRMLRHRKASSASPAALDGAPGSMDQGSGRGATSGGTMTSVDMMHVSAIVVATVLVFLACHSVGVYLALTIASKGRPWVFQRPAYIAMKHVNTVLVMFNSSVNFLLYCAISRKFRKVFMRVVRRRLARWGVDGKNVARREPWTTAMPLSEGGSAGNTLTRSRGSNTEKSYRQPHTQVILNGSGSKVYSSSSKSMTSNGSNSHGDTMRADV
ncbi:hypothetical protein EGW08_010693 [Elysia chlorotica]|uniref:G-protein coupled receptors family 1 profile domain-containing protein n=1 Tax=Elysia chlorotica TaxID=188477 RepID=A0A3S1C309_ELYCH|nr:hypothetical protein EGW08_010693 [Elysia chlorotica]